MSGLSGLQAPGERLDSRVPPWGAPAQGMHAELRSSEVGRAALRLVALDAADRWSVRQFLGNLQSTPESNEPLPGTRLPYHRSGLMLLERGRARPA